MPLLALKLELAIYSILFNLRTFKGDGAKRHFNLADFQLAFEPKLLTYLT